MVDTEHGNKVQRPSPHDYQYNQYNHSVWVAGTVYCSFFTQTCFRLCSDLSGGGWGCKRPLIMTSSVVDSSDLCLVNRLRSSMSSPPLPYLSSPFAVHPPPHCCRFILLHPLTFLMFALSSAPTHNLSPLLSVPNNILLRSSSLRPPSSTRQTAFF